MIASTAVCAAIVGPMFDMPLYMPLIAVVFSVFVSILSVRALGETDLAPVSGIGKVSQLLFALVAPGSACLRNLLLHSRILLLSLHKLLFSGPA